MIKLLIFIGENQKFDVEVTINAIVALSGTTNARRGNFIGAIFECEYVYAGTNTVIRMSKEAETITAEGLHPCSLSFAIELQRALSVDLNATDMEYSFNVALRAFKPLSNWSKPSLLDRPQRDGSRSSQDVTFPAPSQPLSSSSHTLQQLRFFVDDHVCAEPLG